MEGCFEGANTLTGRCPLLVGGVEARLEEELFKKGGQRICGTQILSFGSLIRWTSIAPLTSALCNPSWFSLRPEVGAL